MPLLANSKMVGSILSLLACGLSIGWLTGLSASPVIAAVVAGLLGVATTLASALAGVRGPLQAGEDAKPDPHRRLDRTAASASSPLWVASVVVGIAVGASMGVYARANDWLGADPGRIVARWSKLGLNQQMTATDLFRSLYPSMPTPRQSEGAAAHGWLLAVRRDECETLRAADDSELDQKFISSPNDDVRKLGFIQDPAILRKIANALCSDSR